MISVVGRRSLPQLQFLYSVRNAGYWNKDWQPGPYPETQEQREAAAKKYNLLPEEYKPLDRESGFQSFGDYPQLPDVSVENKDIYYPWDIPEDRRNFGEPFHHMAIVYGENAIDTHHRQKLKYSPWLMFLGTFGFASILYSLKWDPFPFFPPVAARQMPKPGVVNYSYEPAE